jgi:hypothetical protein
MIKEEWRLIQGFDGYQVSNLGRLKSFKKSGEKILKTRINNNGYLVSTIYNKKILVQSIHQLVAMAFLGHKPCGFNLVVDHINNNKLDNRVENLQIITQRKNSSKDVKKLSSKYVGITYHKKACKWQSRILINKIRVNLGFYNTQEEASQVYQNKLKELQLC